MRVRMYEEQFEETLQHLEDLSDGDAETELTNAEAMFPTTTLYQVTSFHSCLPLLFCHNSASPIVRRLKVLLSFISI